MSIDDFTQVAYTALEKLVLENTVINKKREKFVAYDTYYHFRKRHPDLSLRFPEASTSRWFANWSAFYEKYKYGATSGVHTVHKPSKILPKKGVKQFAK